MHVDYQTPSGLPVKILIPSEQVERLKGTCFRYGVQKAGNFSRWSTSVKFFYDSDVQRELWPEVLDLITCDDLGHHSVQISMPYLVGWESTAPCEQFATDALEEYRPNKRSRALRVRPERTDLLAPLTNLLTIVFQIRPNREESGVIVFINSVYPGVDIGELQDDITEREGRVMYMAGNILVSRWSDEAEFVIYNRTILEHSFQNRAVFLH